MQAYAAKSLDLVPRNQIISNDLITCCAKMIPKEIYGNPVRLVADVDPPLFPTGYPGDGGLERTAHFVISVSDEGDADDQRYWVSCVGETGRIMAGEMCYTLDAALAFPISEFDVVTLNWREINPRRSE